MGILGKDLFDIGRPITHTKVQFGRDAYWIEDNPVPYPYGSMLTRLLDYDAAPYLALVSTKKHSRHFAKWSMHSYGFRFTDPTSRTMPLSSQCFYCRILKPGMMCL